MDKRVLLIGGGKSFMVTSIGKELKEQGFDVVQAAPDVTQIENREQAKCVSHLYR